MHIYVCVAVSQTQVVHAVSQRDFPSPRRPFVRLLAPPRLARLLSSVRLRGLLYGGHFPVSFAETPSSSRGRTGELCTGRRIHSGELPASDAGGVAVEGILRGTCDRDGRYCWYYDYGYRRGYLWYAFWYCPIKLILLLSAFLSFLLVPSRSCLPRRLPLLHPFVVSRLEQCCSNFHAHERNVQFMNRCDEVWQASESETHEDSAEGGFVESWRHGGVVPVETQTHVAEHPGIALSTNLPVMLQPSSSSKSDERVDESAVPRSRKIELDPQ